MHAVRGLLIRGMWFSDVRINRADWSSVGTGVAADRYKFRTLTKTFRGSLQFKKYLKIGHTRLHTHSSRFLICNNLSPLHNLSA